MNYLNSYLQSKLDLSHIGFSRNQLRIVDSARSDQPRRRGCGTATAYDHVFLCLLNWSVKSNGALFFTNSPTTI